METIAPTSPPLEPVTVPPEVYAFPATPQQQQLWFLDSLYLGNAAYNIPLAYELHGALDADALDRSLRHVVNRHENLRTTFAMRGDEFLQVVDPQSDLAFARIDLSGLPDAERDVEWRKRVAREAASRFDLARGPLVRGTLLHLGPVHHIVVFNFHHIILDHLSVLQFAREFAAAYGELRRGHAPAEEPAPFQYPDFAVWQNEQFEDPTFQADLQDWLARLDGAPNDTPLPFDRPRGATQTFVGREVKFALPPELSARLKEFARTSRKSIYVTLLTAFKCLLARYSGHNDVVVGSPFSNRTIPALEGVMGCCMNTLPLRTRLDPEVSFAQALNSVHQTFLAAYQRQRVPLKLIVDQGQLDRNASHNPLFQNTFIVQDPPMEVTLEGLRVAPLSIHNETSKFDMAVWMWDAGDTLCGVWEYNVALFEADSIERMICNFQTFVADAVARPEHPWRRLNLLAPAERVRLLETFNRTRRDYARDDTVVQLVEAAAAKDGSRIALVQGKTMLTYRELLDQSDRLARRLVSAGVQPGHLVGIYLERSPAMVVAMLAILRAGAGYLPLDPAFPADRIKFMIEDAAVPVIVSQSPLDRELPAHEAKLLPVEPTGQPSAALEPLRTRPDPLARAYVRYTSGSTGRPKGVAVGHRALVNFLLAMQSEPGFTSEDVLLAVTTLSFDISELEVWLPLISGGRVVLAARTEAVDGAALAALLHRHHVTVMQATPATWRLLHEAGWDGDRDLKVLCGGEAFPPELAQRLARSCGQVWNMYGPTETTVWSGVRQVRPGEAVVVGGPIANTDFYVVDDHLQPVPLAAPGELLIGGDGLAEGYLHRPELTAERFVPSPFAAGARLYRTGDLVKWRRDGTLEFLGRIDNQVKLRGYRIELGEIETALAAVPDVKQAVVVVRDEHLAAYYVSTSGSPVDASHCRETLRAQLPDYMVPAFFVHLASFPLTPNGKIDRKALPAPDQVATAPAEAYVAPRTELEQRLASLWEQVLKRSRIGVFDNFFDLGGHSLLAVTLFGRIEKLFGRRLPLASLFQNPNIAGLATLLASATAPAHQWRALVPIRPEGDGPAIYFVHGAGGNILIYRSLAAYLTPGLPVYGLQSLGLDGLTAPRATVEEMADAYVQEIVQRQPAGPYHLAGYCMGGKVAFEIARRLQAQGREVGLLALLDSYNFVAAVRVSKLAFYRQMLGFHLRNIIELPPLEAGAYLREKFRMLVEFAQARVAATFKRLRRDGGQADTSARVGDFIQQVNDRAGEIYVPQPYQGDVTLFKPHRNYAIFSDPEMGWRNVTGGRLELVALDLNPHAMLVEPYVRKLATAINARMDRAR